MRLYYLKSKEEFNKLDKNELEEHEKALQKLIPESEKNFKFKGFSLVAEDTVEFDVLFGNGLSYPNVNWRETVNCPITFFNNRMRFALMIIDTLGRILKDDKVYIMEQVTPLYKHLKNKYPNLIGSEYFDASTVSGYINNEGVMHQDAIRLSFNDQEFKAILSFDVFEHVPDYKKAFMESYRVLENGGRLIFTAPFISDADETQIRARLDSNGEINHILEPEYHGDPMSSEGILCFQHFGWDILSLFKEIGFKDAYAVVGWSFGLGFLTPQMIFIAEK